MTLTLAKLESGKTKPGDCNSKETMPAWADPQRCERAQRFFMDNLTAMLFAFHLALVSGLSLPAFLQVLSRTGQSSTPSTSIRRYLMTLAYITQWHEGDVTDPKSACRRSLHAVRTMHHRVVTSLGGADGNCREQVSTSSGCPMAMLSSEDGNDDSRYHGNVNKNGSSPSPPSRLLVITQYDMAITQTCFFGMALLLRSAVGLRCSREQLEDYIHFWRVIGYLLGIEDAYNAAAVTYEEAAALCNEISETLFSPAIANPCPLFTKMADAYCDGFNDVLCRGLPVISTKATLAYAELAYGRPLFHSLSVADWLRVYLTRLFIGMLCWCPGFSTVSDILLYRLYKNIQHSYHFAYNKPKH